MLFATALTLSLALAPVQDPEPLTLDVATFCAGVFFAHSRQPEIAELDGVELYEQLVVVFLDRGEALGAPAGLDREAVISRSANAADRLTATLAQQETAEARTTMLNQWFELEQACVAAAEVSEPLD
ncbi:hypothetical protein [Brevundimonas sp. A19_0]|uniref:hypothetical protein n=1 Tax=Brevundimonas sp. A19_0 TaxID=2821087 RepID=UPI001AD9D548|nr:hypothetical protein [Brevundimonas sp. A19_0]MBO9500147.1 hypothetical protein [Brevundimonas sp. A19_0]